LTIAGLRPAPEYGSGMYIASAKQIEQIVEGKVQKIQASLNALKRYMEELEEELIKKEDQLEEVQIQLQEEEELRLAAEAERDELLEQRACLEAKLVEDKREEQNAQQQVDDFDRQAEEVAERLARGEIDEEEASRIEEELIRAEARRLTARESSRQDGEDLQKVSVASEEANKKIAEMSREGERLQEEMRKMREEMAAVEAEREEEAKKRVEADSRFNALVQRIQAKVGGR